jgi:hypothetical protein
VSAPKGKSASSPHLFISAFFHVLPAAFLQEKHKKKTRVLFLTPYVFFTPERILEDPNGILCLEARWKTLLMETLCFVRVALFVCA